MERDIAAGNTAVKRKTEKDFRRDALVDESGNIFASMSSVATARMRASPQMLDPSVNRAQKGRWLFAADETELPRSMEATLLVLLPASTRARVVSPHLFRLRVLLHRKPERWT